MPNQIECMFCKKQAEKLNDDKDILEIKCTYCGEYTVTFEFYKNFPRDNEKTIEKHIISGIIRERFERNLHKQKITDQNFTDILHSVNIPKTIKQKFDKLILYLYRHSKGFYDSVEVGRYPAICYAFDERELKYILKVLGEERYIDIVSNAVCVLKLKGVERAEELLSKQIDSNQCFVAMWFDEELEGVFEKYISIAIEAKTLDGKEIPNERGYKAIKIDMKEFNDEIIDNIISEKRKAGLSLRTSQAIVKVFIMNLVLLMA